MKRLLRFVRPILALALVVALTTAAYLYRDELSGLLRHAPMRQAEGPSQQAAEASEAPDATEQIVLSDQAIANLGLVAKPVKPQTYWKTLQVPGMVVDQPGLSDRGVVSPATGVVTAIYYVPGDTVRPGDALFVVRLLSESLHQTQSDLFKTSQDVKLAEATRQRLQESRGAVSGARLIEAENQITRLEVAVKAYRQELLNRGLLPEQVALIGDGQFVTEIVITVPMPTAEPTPSTTPVALPSAADDPSAGSQPMYEIEEIQAELGVQVEAGQTLCRLANHQVLAIEGRAFRDETLLLERSVEEAWPVEVDFQERAASGWPPVAQTFQISHIANTIDPVNRTFAFRIPLQNQSKEVRQAERTQLLWRFRPGQKVRIQIPVERIDNVFVLPADAVTRQLAEAFVFTQNVNTFERRPVRVVAEDRQHTVLANDGSLVPGMFVVQNAAAQLDRMTKSQAASGLPEGYHMHADGSLHKNEDEGN